MSLSDMWAAVDVRLITAAVAPAGVTKVTWWLYVLLAGPLGATVLAFGYLRSIGARHGPVCCPSCGTPARVHDPYLMCDACERVIGLAPDMLSR